MSVSSDGAAAHCASEQLTFSPAEACGKLIKVAARKPQEKSVFYFSPQPPQNFHPLMFDPCLRQFLSNIFCFFSPCKPFWFV